MMFPLSPIFAKVCSSRVFTFEVLVVSFAGNALLVRVAGGPSAYSVDETKPKSYFLPSLCYSSVSRIVGAQSVVGSDLLDAGKVCLSFE